LNTTEFFRIKKKILEIDSTKYWGDDFDVRYYLISNLKKLRKKYVIDIGGGIGIISSELDKSNFRVNLDLSFGDLKTCNIKVDPNIQNICSSFTNLPFPKEAYDYVICSHLLEIAKQYDLENNIIEIKDGSTKYPTVNKCIKEIHRILKIGGTFYLTTPNNAYYKSTKLSFDELNDVIFNYFPKTEISFYNTLPKFSKKNRKLNLANIIPKLKSKVINSDKIIDSLIKKNSKNNYSVAFFVKAKR
jgi:ubiquinone/menaquinone biosynthesis C-methylase UbiE